VNFQDKRTRKKLNVAEKDKIDSVSFAVKDANKYIFKAESGFKYRLDRTINRKRKSRYKLILNSEDQAKQAKPPIHFFINTASSRSK
jgi:hypothetical protein